MILNSLPGVNSNMQIYMPGVFLFDNIWRLRNDN